ncbi:MAG: hypothetical protein ACRDOD_25180, partial [Streptosporangiaceae bacterium]
MGDHRHLHVPPAGQPPRQPPGFSPPTSRVRLSFIAAMEEFRAEGRGSATDDTMLGREIRDFGL